MIAVLKIFFACFVGIAWYHLNGPDQAPIAGIIFLMILIASFVKPVRYQDPKERDEYRHKMQEARERKRLILEQQKEEKKILKKQALDDEERRKKELKEKLNL